MFVYLLNVYFCIYNECIFLYIGYTWYNTVYKMYKCSRISIQTASLGYR